MPEMNDNLKRAEAVFAMLSSMGYEPRRSENIALAIRGEVDGLDYTCKITGRIGIAWSWSAEEGIRIYPVENRITVGPSMEIYQGCRGITPSSEHGIVLPMPSAICETKAFVDMVKSLHGIVRNGFFTQGHYKRMEAIRDWATVKEKANLYRSGFSASSTFYFRPAREEVISSDGAREAFTWRTTHDAFHPS